MTVGRPRGGFGAKPLTITVECTGCRVKKMEIARLQEVINSTRLLVDELAETVRVCIYSLDLEYPHGRDAKLTAESALEKVPA